MVASLAAHIQRKLQRLYALDDLPHIDDFARPCAEGEREQVLVREDDDGVSIAVLLPAEGLGPARALALDPLCQVVEGVSHFLYLSQRIRQNLPTTRLELELQAEVDKFALLALDGAGLADPARIWKIHTRLYESVSFTHDASSEEGQRYRLANTLAARFCARLGAEGEGALSARQRLRAFHRAGQADKIRLASAA